MANNYYLLKPTSYLLRGGKLRVGTPIICAAFNPFLIIYATIWQFLLLGGGRRWVIS
jgi:hypothetical protein